ncbi:hypothetical protein FJ365_00790 [Candidatus Dependentiae bacterium]|nr:hypothetical protein [Candidatus Dependentiae bacterium]
MKNVLLFSLSFLAVGLNAATDSKAFYGSLAAGTTVAAGTLIALNEDPVKAATHVLGALTAAGLIGTATHLAISKWEAIKAGFLRGCEKISSAIDSTVGIPTTASSLRKWATSTAGAITGGVFTYGIMPIEGAGNPYATGALVLIGSFAGTASAHAAARALLNSMGYTVTVTETAPQ